MANKRSEISRVNVNTSRDARTLQSIVSALEYDLSNIDLDCFSKYGMQQLINLIDSRIPKPEPPVASILKTEVTADAITNNDAQ